jgi:hypothetical protein
MRCEDARTQLFDYVDDTLDGYESAKLADHLESCTSCRSDFEAINDLALQATVWHDLAAPRWQPPRVTRQFNFGGFLQWFPSLASALALILVVGVYLRQPDPVAPVSNAQIPTLPGGSFAPANASFDAAFSSNRMERQQELQALVQILRTEMDRRNEETEESLRYVIAHQIQGQREIDDLYQYIRKVSLDGSAEPLGSVDEEQL